MDTDDLSKETYKGILIEAGRFHEDLALQFGLIAERCKDEEDYIQKAIRLIKRLKKIPPYLYSDVFFENIPKQADLNKTLDIILDNIEKVSCK